MANSLSKSMPRLATMLAIFGRARAAKVEPTIPAPVQTVEAVLNTFVTVVDTLETLQVQHSDNISAAERALKEAADKKAAAEAEIAAAATAVKNIKALIGR